MQELPQGAQIDPRSRAVILPPARGEQHYRALERRVRVLELELEELKRSMRLTSGNT